MMSNEIVGSQTPVNRNVDVVIMGGGLAGLTLALQLRRRFPSLSIQVLERHVYPVSVAAHKIGESTVEIGARYLADVLDLKEHLVSSQLNKFGFRFFFSEGQRELNKVTEIGVSRALRTPSYQIDRGVFENFLADHVRTNGIELIDDARVTEVGLIESEQEATAEQAHQIEWSRQSESHRTSARWVIDASGRAGLIKRKLGLAQTNDHAAYAVWFRIKGTIRIDDWVDDPAWKARCDPPARWLSTNHLVGAGYWVWLIPLSSGHHSIGIVADPRHHPINRMNTFDKAMDWLEEYQPRLFDDLDGRREDVIDFVSFKRFSYGCKQVFSQDRWALTGEAGLFLDPFYSPGTDFIAISNTFITELVARDNARERLGAHAHTYDQLYQSFYQSTLALYVDQYAIFGDPEVLPRKVIWDYTYYWGVLSQLFFQERLADLSMLSQLREELSHCQALNLAMQRFLREWSTLSNKSNPAVMHDQALLPWFAQLNASLLDQLDADQFRQRIKASSRQLTRLAWELVQRATADYPSIDPTGLNAAIAAMPGATDHRLSDAEPLLTF